MAGDAKKAGKGPSASSGPPAAAATSQSPTVRIEQNVQGFTGLSMWNPAAAMIYPENVPSGLSSEGLIGTGGAAVAGESVTGDGLSITSTQPSLASAFATNGSSSTGEYGLFSLSPASATSTLWSPWAAQPLISATTGSHQASPLSNQAHVVTAAAAWGAAESCALSPRCNLVSSGWQTGVPQQETNASPSSRAATPIEIIGGYTERATVAAPSPGRRTSSARGDSSNGFPLNTSEHSGPRARAGSRTSIKNSAMDGHHFLSSVTVSSPLSLAALVGESSPSAGWNPFLYAAPAQASAQSSLQRAADPHAGGEYGAEYDYAEYARRMGLGIDDIVGEGGGGDDTTDEETLRILSGTLEAEGGSPSRTLTGTKGALVPPPGLLRTELKAPPGVESADESTSSELGLDRTDNVSAEPSDRSGRESSLDKAIGAESGEGTHTFSNIKNVLPAQDNSESKVSSDRPKSVKGLVPESASPSGANKDAEQTETGTQVNRTLSASPLSVPAPVAPKKPMSWANIAKAQSKSGPISSGAVQPSSHPNATNSRTQLPASVVTHVSVTSSSVPATRLPGGPANWACLAANRNAPKPNIPATAPTPVVTPPASNGPSPSSGLSLVPTGTAVDLKEAKKKVADLFKVRRVNPGLKEFWGGIGGKSRFFVIKSYTEDDVHKSLKYSIWSSTDMGNRRLNQAYLDTSATGAGNRPGTSGGSVYLFFSVNASGHFCGVATMTSKVDWETSASVWAQGGKWKGVFGVRWVFVKDVPNGALRHLRVITNENKPVTNSRDTQELPTDIGREMLRIFCEYRHTTCILDDWGWHEKKESEKNGDAGTVEPTVDGGSSGTSTGSNLLNIGDVMRMNGAGNVADGNVAKRTGSGAGGRW